jgi:hypothetical protein
MATQETHPLDLARKELLAITPEADRAVLQAKLNQIDHRRVDDSHALDSQIYRRHDPMGRTGGRAGHQDRFNAMPALAEKARDETIAACLTAGIRDDAPIVKFVSADLFHFLHAYAMSRFGHDGGTGLRFVEFCDVTASALSSRVKDDVTVARAAFNAGEPAPIIRWWQRQKRRPLIGAVLVVGGGLIGLLLWLVANREFIKEGHDRLTGVAPRASASAQPATPPPQTSVPAKR